MSMYRMSWPLRLHLILNNTPGGPHQAVFSALFFLSLFLVYHEALPLALSDNLACQLIPAWYDSESHS